MKRLGRDGRPPFHTRNWAAVTSRTWRLRQLVPQGISFERVRTRSAGSPTCRLRSVWAQARAYWCSLPTSTSSSARRTGSRLTAYAASYTPAMAPADVLRQGPTVRSGCSTRFATRSPSGALENGAQIARASRCPSELSEWRSPFFSLPSQAFVCVLDQQVTDREATPLGLGGKPVGQLGRGDNGATDAVVALPHFVGRLRQALSSRTQFVVTVPRAERIGGGRDRSTDRGNSGWGSPAPGRARPAPVEGAAGSGRRSAGRLRCAARAWLPRGR